MTSIARPCFVGLALYACSGAGRPAPAPLRAPTTASSAPASEPPPATSARATEVASAAPGPEAGPKTGGHMVLSAPPRTLEVVADTGARITEFSLDGRNVLATPKDDAYSYGATFWPSPQKPWGWPPPEEIDIGPYTATRTGNVITLTSAPSPRVGLSLTKTIRLDAATGTVHVDYTLHNVKDAPVEVAPWENLRVRPLGITFFPIDGKPAPQSTLELSVHKGLATYAHHPERPAVGQKAFADGKEGWLAHIDRSTAEPLVLILEFEDVPRQAQAPGEGEIELYVDGNNKFAEVEHQGRFGKLQPNASLTWSVTWHLERLPAGTSVWDGAALAGFVRKTLGRP